ncbi:MAG: APC family permease [Lachnospiraceae bacterium]|nr:APC family permease [Lachnospiraceae bacterium]
MANQTDQNGLERYLSPLAVWALSFGCAVGWGSFVMPGTTFLPKAGPAGTAAGILAGALVMFVIGVNYHYLMNKYPDSGGTLTYSIKAFGYDHGFLSSWFLILVYVAIMWANATALPLIGRNLLGDTFLFGFHYTILGYDVYFGEILLSVSAIVICGLVCILGKHIATGLQILFALLLLGGVMIAAVAVFGKGSVDFSSFSPAFVPGGKAPLRQIFTIVALSPWAFVGFESVSNSTASFRFSTKKTLAVLTVSLVTGTFVYITLALMAALALPEGCSSWTEYIGNLGSFTALQGLPTFYMIYKAMGNIGVFILGLAAMGGILTGLIGNFIAGSHLIHAMAGEGILPGWFGRLNRDSAHRNALLFLSGISLFIPFLGRTATGWIVDVNTVGAIVAYAYSSAAALYFARKEGKRGVQVTGIAGLAMSVVFFFYFMSWSAGAMSTESYLILVTWSILGFLYFLCVFAKDTKKRFGKSTVVWLASFS